MIGILLFDFSNEDDSEDFKVMRRARDVELALWHFMEELRKRAKYGYADESEGREGSEKSELTWQTFRDLACEFLGDVEGLELP